MEHSAILVAIAIANFIVSIIFIPAGLVWKASRIEKSIRDDIHKSQGEIDSKIDAQYRQFGEAVGALRQFVNAELITLRKELSEESKFARDTFMRRDSFYKVQEAMQTEMAKLGDRIEARFVRIEEKIDNK